MYNYYVRAFLNPTTSDPVVAVYGCLDTALIKAIGMTFEKNVITVQIYDDNHMEWAKLAGRCI